MIKQTNEDLKGKILKAEKLPAHEKMLSKEPRSTQSKCPINGMRHKHNKIYVHFDCESGLLVGVQTNGIPVDHALICTLLHELDYVQVGVVYHLESFGSFVCTRKIKMGASYIAVILEEVVIKDNIYTNNF